MNYPNLSTNPGPPPSSGNNPPNFSPSSSGACPPPFGASGVSHLLRFSPLPFDGNEGKNSGCFGLGSSLKYGCWSASAADIRFDGSRLRSELRRSTPVPVRREPSRAWSKEPFVLLVLGKFRFFALGRSLNDGHVSSVGIPTNSNIYVRFQLMGLLLQAGRSHFYPVEEVPLDIILRICILYSTYRFLFRTPLSPAEVLELCHQYHN